MDNIMELTMRHLESAEIYYLSKRYYDDACGFMESNKFSSAAESALKSLLYSVGVFHPSYKKAERYVQLRKKLRLVLEKL